jgi:hypothetical protein
VTAAGFVPTILMVEFTVFGDYAEFRISLKQDNGKGSFIDTDYDFSFVATETSGLAKPI